MIRSAEVYTLQGDPSCTLFGYDGDFYYIDETNQISLIPTRVANCLINAQVAVRNGSVVEKTAQEIANMGIPNIQWSTMFSDIYRPDRKAQPLVIGTDLYYLKNSFLEDFPDGEYVFENDSAKVKLVTRRGAVLRYESLEVGSAKPKEKDELFSGEQTKLQYLFKKNEFSYVGLDVV